MIKATPENFEFSIKVPERITHKKRLDLSKDVISDLEEFLDKISPLYHANKLGAILIQLPPSFTIASFNILENFLEKLPRKSESVRSYSNDEHLKKEIKIGNKRAVEEY